MQRFDRILGILLFLRSGQSVSASVLARHFAVSTRTIYRDLETLSAVGVPIYAERGRRGGVRLLEGYFLPPLMFSQSEAIALLVGLTLQKSLQATPFPAERAMAEKKLLAALPDKLRATLAKAEKMIGFEQLPNDIFHPEPVNPQPSLPAMTAVQAEHQESQSISIFFQAILDGNHVLLRYHSPYQPRPSEVQAEPLGLFWDRNHWYLVGRQTEQEERFRPWRADRVLQIKPRQPVDKVQSEFDVRKLLGHTWLQSAMEDWRRQAPVKIRLSSSQAARLQQDWYYRHAQFEQFAENGVVMTFGEGDQSIVLELLRWLGPDAELIEPSAWRERMHDELQQMLVSYLSS